MEINIGDLTSPDVINLLKMHHKEMLKHSPIESVHALDLTKLSAPNVTFWTVSINNEIAGCGALMALNSTDAEIKSMRTSNKHLRKGVARTLLAYIIDYAKNHSYLRLSLETGSMEVFTPAHQLYQSFGFKPCLPFANYKNDPFSTFMTLVL